MTEAVSSKDICFIQPVLLWLELRHFSLILRRMAHLPPGPQIKIRVNSAMNLTHSPFCSIEDFIDSIIVVYHVL